MWKEAKTHTIWNAMFFLCCGVGALIHGVQIAQTEKCSIPGISIVVFLTVFYNIIDLIWVIIYPSAVQNKPNPTIYETFIIVIHHICVLGIGLSICVCLCVLRCFCMINVQIKKKNILTHILSHCHTP